MCSLNNSLLQIKRAEVKVAVTLAHHNIPLAAMDHLSPLFQDIFPDSKIAKGSLQQEQRLPAS